jgi:hypothetical protein
MSYDIYCYRPASRRPNEEEALAVISSEEDEVDRDDDEARKTKELVAEALLAYNPRLERFKIDYSEVAEFRNISEERARAQLSHIEINTPDSDLRMQLTVFSDHVSLTIPYWYTGKNADLVFDQVNAYLLVIRKAVGYFAYDPQTESVFDPQTDVIGNHSEYNRIAENLPAIIAQSEARTKKPWWKFW